MNKFQSHDRKWNYSGALGIPSIHNCSYSQYSMYICSCFSACSENIMQNVKYSYWIKNNMNEKNEERIKIHAKMRPALILHKLKWIPPLMSICFSWTQPTTASHCNGNKTRTPNTKRQIRWQLYTNEEKKNWWRKWLGWIICVYSSEIFLFRFFID